jgi:uncharacterized membrane protein YccC
LRVSYAVAVVWITLLLALLYTWLGRPPGLLWTRLAETLVGAAVGGVVATLVRPAGTRARVREAEKRMLGEVAACLSGLAAGLRGGGRRTSRSRARGARTWSFERSEGRRAR